MIQIIITIIIYDLLVLFERWRPKFYDHIPIVDMPSSITNVYQNKHCILQLYRDGNTIYVEEVKEPYRTFKIKRSEWQNCDIWTILIKNFTKKTSYQEIEEICKINNVQITKPQKPELPRKPQKKLPSPIDINNAQLEELTKLPGINIALAKKIIKKREEIEGFKNTEEFFSFINVKTHFEEQIKQRIFVNPKKKKRKLFKFKERNLDI